MIGAQTLIEVVDINKKGLAHVVSFLSPAVPRKGEQFVFGVDFYRVESVTWSVYSGKTAKSLVRAIVYVEETTCD